VQNLRGLRKVEHAAEKAVPSDLPGMQGRFVPAASLGKTLMVNGFSTTNLFTGVLNCVALEKSFLWATLLTGGVNASCPSRQTLWG